MKVTQILALSGHSIGLGLAMVSPSFTVFSKREAIARMHPLSSRKVSSPKALPGSAASQENLHSGSRSNIYCTRLDRQADSATEPISVSVNLTFTLCASKH